MALMLPTMSDKCNSLSAFDENFGMGMDFNHIKRQFREWIEKQSTSSSLATSNDSSSTVTTLNDKFEVTIDVYQFKSEEITIKVVGSNTICIEGNHEEQHQDQGFISRQFVRKFTLPDGYDITNVVSSLSSDGILRIIAPRNGQTIENYRNICNAQQKTQSNESVQSKKQTQHTGENIQKEDYNQVSTQYKNTVDRNQMNRESNFHSAKTTKEFEETHNYIQEFLHNIDSKYKVVPIKQVGPFSNSNEHLEQTKSNINTTRQEETYKKQRECHNVPIRQTNATYSTSFESESKVESSRRPEYHTVPIRQTNVNDKRTTDIFNESSENRSQNRKCSIDIQKEVVQEYRNVPIQQTHTQSQNSNIKKTSESTITKNLESHVSNINSSPEYRTIPIKQTGVNNEDTLKKCSKFEETTTWKTEEARNDYRTVPIQQTGVNPNTGMFQHDVEKTENLLQNTNTQNIERSRIPVEESTIKKTVTESMETQEIYNTNNNYRTIPIKQVNITQQESTTENILSNKRNDQHKHTQNATNIEEEKNSLYEAQESNTIPIQKSQINKPTSKNIESVDEWEIHEKQNEQTARRASGVITEINKTEIHKKVFKNGSIDSQFNTEETECTIKTENQANNRIPIIPNKRGVQENNTTEEKLFETENEIRCVKTIPTNVARATKQESYEQTIYKNDSIDSERVKNIKESEEIENWEKINNAHEYKTVPTTQTNVPREQELYKNRAENEQQFQNSSKYSEQTYEQTILKNNSLDSRRNAKNEEMKSYEDVNKMRNTLAGETKITSDSENELYKNNLMYSNDANKKSNTFESSENVQQSSNFTKTSKYMQENMNSFRNDASFNQTQINKHNEMNSNNNSQTLSELNSNTSENNLLMQESDFTKEDSVKDGYKQSGFTKKNAKAEVVALPDGFKMINQQSVYSEQTKTKEWSSNKNDNHSDQAHNNAYQVQFSVDSNSSERFSRMPSETSEICIEEITEGNEKIRRGSTAGYRKYETSQYSSNTDHTVHVQRN